MAVGVAHDMVCSNALCTKLILTGRAFLLQELEHVGFCEDFEEI